MAKLFTILVTLVSVHMVSLAMADDKTPVIAVVVGSQETVKSLKLSTKNLNLIYWRKQQFWPQGLRIKPVNLKSQHLIRVAFSKTVLGSAPNTQVAYWNEQYFNGILPPHSVDSEEAVIRYIESTKGAIGYINACNLDKRIFPALWITNGKITKNKPALSCK